MQWSVHRLIPKRGAGPALRGGHEIDEYLMRLLRVGAANEKEARLYAEVRFTLQSSRPQQQSNLPPALILLRFDHIMDGLRAGM